MNYKFSTVFLHLLRYPHPVQCCQSSSSSNCPCRSLSSWMCCILPAAARASSQHKALRHRRLNQAVHPQKPPRMLGMVQTVHSQKSPRTLALNQAVHPQKSLAGGLSSMPARPVALKKLLLFFPSNTFKSINMHMRSLKMSHISVSSNY